jgi:UDP-N-acetylglucosamine 2-epimerase
MVDMKKLKVMTVVGTRPEIIRLSCVIKKLDAICDHVLVHTGQNYDYELNQIFFDEMGIRQPNIFLAAAGANSIVTIGNILIAIDSVFESEKPDALLILGDTNSCLVAIPAKRRKIPIFHMEAGNRCFDLRVPEEVNRKIVDHISDINLTYSSISREYLLREGIPGDQIIKVGSPMREVILAYEDLIEKSTILDDLGLTEKQYFVISAHREENIEDEPTLQKLVSLIIRLEEEYHLPVVVSTHPRTRKRLEPYLDGFNDAIQFMRPLGYGSYNKLQIFSKLVLSDSGTITEEASLLGFAAVNLREVHERPEGMEEGAVILTGMDFNRIQQAITIYDQSDNSVGGYSDAVSDYMAQNVSDKVLKIIHSYVNYVNKFTWKKCDA